MAMKMSAATMTMPTQAEMVGLRPRIFMSLPHRWFAQARIDEDAQYVRNGVENDERAGEDQAAGLHHRQVALGDAVDHVLADPGIDEDHFDDDDADDEVGKVERHDGDDRRGGIRQGMPDDHA